MTMPAPTMNDDGLKNSLIASAVVHVVALLFLYFGLPRLMPPPPEVNVPVPFEIVEIADMTTVKPQETPPDVKPTPPEPPKPPPPKVEQVSPPQALPPPIPEIPKPAPQAEALKAAPVPKVKPPEPKPVAEDFSKLLRNLESKKPDTPKPAETKPDAKVQPAPQAAAAPVALSEHETRTLQDAIRSQIMHCWNPPIGARDIQNLVVELGMDVTADGTVITTDIVDKSRYASDSYFRAAADSAVRAVRNPSCSPLKLPADQYSYWKHIDFIFDPRDL